MLKPQVHSVFLSQSLDHHGFDTAPGAFIILVVFEGDDQVALCDDEGEGRDAGCGVVLVDAGKVLDSFVSSPLPGMAARITKRGEGRDHTYHPDIYLVSIFHWAAKLQVGFHRLNHAVILRVLRIIGRIAIRVPVYPAIRKENHKLGLLIFCS